MSVIVAIHNNSQNITFSKLSEIQKFLLSNNNQIRIKSKTISNLLIFNWHIIIIFIYNR